MKKNQKFEREGKQYEILKDGTEYFPEKPKLCIKPPEKDHKIGIDSAVKDKLIKETGITLPLSSIGVNESPNLALFGSENILDSNLSKSMISNSYEGSEPEESQTEITGTDVDSNQEDPKTYSGHEEFSANRNNMPSLNNAEQTDDQDHTNKIIDSKIENSGIDHCSRCREDKTGEEEVSQTSEMLVLHGPGQTYDQNQNIYFMPVEQLRARVFLAHGLIYPAIYDKDTRCSADFVDCQISQHHLTLFKSPQPLSSNQLLLEILLRPREIQEAKGSTEVLRITLPLPISRLVGILVPAYAEDLDRFINGWITPDVPVPRHLFKSVPKDVIKTIDDPCEEDAGQEIEPDREIVEAISKFDSYLGMMAFWRNADRYVSGNSGYYADYPDSYLAICNRILGQSDLRQPSWSHLDQLLCALLDLDLETSISAEVIELAKSKLPYVEQSLVRSFAEKIYKNHEKKIELGQAFNLLLRGDYRSAAQKLQDPALPIEAAILAALFKFSNRQSNDHQIVKQRLHEDWPESDRRSAILASIGSFYGYTALSAREYRLYSVHPLLEDKIERRPEIKFHLTSVFERKIIESLYQYAFYKHNSDLDFDSIYDNTPDECKSGPEAASSDQIKISTENFHGICVCRYEIKISDNKLDEILQDMIKWDREWIDENCEVGRYLGLEIFSLDQYELIGRIGCQSKIRYKVEKRKLVEILRNSEIKFNVDILKAALDIDIRGDIP